MKTLLIPLVLLLLGVGGGVGAGLALAPRAPEGAPAAAEAHADMEPDAAPAAAAHDEAAHDEAAHGEAAPAEEAPAEEDHAEASAESAIAGHDYVRFNNQFVVPVVTDGAVDSLVLLSLSVEVTEGQEETILLIEPKLRDVFLQVLFDHANTGGFEGMFTAASAMRGLRGALLAAAQDTAGDLVTDVLIIELVRQDA